VPSSTGKKPSVFWGAKILEASDERVLLKLPRRDSGRWTLVLALALAWAAPAVLLYLKSIGVTDSAHIAAVIGLGGVIVLLPWLWLKEIAFHWSRLAPLTGEIELRRHGDEVLLRTKAHGDEASARRGLFFFEFESINTLVLVVGSKVASVTYYVRNVGGGLNWNEIGQWDAARAALVSGSRAVEDNWTPRSVVPLVHAMLRVLELGPQRAVSPDYGHGCGYMFGLMFLFLALPLLHGLVLAGLDKYGNPLAPLGPVASGVVIGAMLVIPHACLFIWNVRRFWLRRLNRKGAEMVALCQMREDRPSGTC